MQTREIPVYLLDKLESDRKRLYDWFEQYFPNDKHKLMEFSGLTETMWEVANHKQF